jgi:protease IV
MKEYFIWLAKLLTLVVIFFVIVPVLLIATLSATQTALQEKINESKHTVAVVEVTGIIESSKDVVAELYKQAENKSVKGIVLRINSPGGAVGPSQEIYSAVSKIKAQKPVVASMEGVAASGGLYAALGASKIYCQPGTMTGSIGVIMHLPNFKKVTDWLGVDVVTIKSGELKDIGNSFREMTEGEREFLTKTAERVHRDFITAVVEGRGLDKAEVEKWADGRVILGNEAKEIKLIVHDAARAVFELLGTPLKPEEFPTLVYPADKFAGLKKILEAASDLPLLRSRSIELRYMMQ